MLLGNESKIDLNWNRRLSRFFNFIANLNLHSNIIFNCNLLFQFELEVDLVKFL